ncbi:MAG: (E)-4-hydroxy-3-methylbut-2-enyl-diphosphate synthase [Leptospiraceae bacterium]|nr:(E)-4-hydroxy-3-methylbut-2-enyl-diphosphate synthase [Leptospiraceae bacterium]MCK6379797.1 (E)-4-hydroxy-3-methylbut-2-enyl-diphosphate synthase [Leptospiraceae bacterium]NUM41424.1 (E)-4-hydroxy-3-methylbut-2-enyl-diphosphate synthase [Leptospiraceae bacterium]
MNLAYNLSPFYYKRKKTKSVKVGNIEIGGTNPIRIQSMTTSDTQDTVNSVKQILDLENAGCEIVRLTVPSMADALNLPNIRIELKKHKSKVPLVADIHFTPSVALKVVEFVEKIRINPGNFADKKKIASIEYSDKDYELELERIFEIFRPLLVRCKELGVALRIGTNHGSLSDRIMNRFGDTPKGMVESAIEFIKMAETENYRDIVVSMKSSNPQVMVQAYRLLASRFDELKMDYPLHLGVTEAGDGKDGRIKSAIGIGSLLNDGLGDTIRVSLTEDAVNEIPVAKKIIQYSTIETSVPSTKKYFEFRNPFQYSRFHSNLVCSKNFKIGENTPVKIETILDTGLNNQALQDTIQSFLQKKDKTIIPDIFHFLANSKEKLTFYSNLKNTNFPELPFSVELTDKIKFKELEFLNELQNFDKLIIDIFDFPKESFTEIIDLIQNLTKKEKILELRIKPENFNELENLLENSEFQKLKNLLFSVKTKNIIFDYRKLGYILQNTAYPFALFSDSDNIKNALYESSIGLGGLLIDGIGDLVRISIEGENINESLELTKDILQAVRLRISKTEFISCPSCGRTLFNLQETTKRIKKRTEHLKGVKIAIMGCIVNGPGEMADADFGYVGAGPGKVHLYKGKEIIEKSIPFEIADQKLVDLIKDSGMWKDP